MPHMIPEYSEGKWIMVDTECGTTVIPYDVIDERPTKSNVREYIEGNEIYSIGLRQGWGARLSAPGYMDCTDWSVFDTEEEARKYIADTYDVDPTTGESRPYADDEDEEES